MLRVEGLLDISSSLILTKFGIRNFRCTGRITHAYTRARSSVTTCASGLDNVLWYCPWEIQQGISIFHGCTEISSMARPFDDKRTLTRRGRKPKCVHPVYQRGLWIRPIDGFGAGVDQSTNSTLKASGHSYSTDPIRSLFVSLTNFIFFPLIHTLLCWNLCFLYIPHYILL